jgi:hypothetical protein
MEGDRPFLLHGQMVPDTTVGQTQGTPRGLFVEAVRPALEQLSARGPDRRLGHFGQRPPFASSFSNPRPGQYPWTEIAKAGGEAIQTGLLEQEVINEQLFDILRQALPTIGEEARTNDNFVLKLPREKALEGAVPFYKVLAIDQGFLVPDVALRVVSEIDDIEQWRV